MGFKSDLDALVLGVLQDGPTHGYEIAKRIKTLSGAALQVGEGQLYPILHALERQGCITAEWVPQEGKPARKVYDLTESGKGELARRRKSWEQFAAGVSLVIGSRVAETRNV